MEIIGDLFFRYGVSHKVSARWRFMATKKQSLAYSLIKAESLVDLLIDSLKYGALILVRYEMC